MSYAKEARILLDLIQSTSSTRGKLTRTRRVLEDVSNRAYADGKAFGEHTAGPGAEELTAKVLELSCQLVAEKERLAESQKLTVESNNKLIAEQDRFTQLREQYQNLNQGSLQQVKQINQLNGKVQEQANEIRSRANTNDSLCTKITALQEANHRLGRLLDEARDEVKRRDEMLSVDTVSEDTSVELETWRLVGENLRGHPDNPAFELALAMAERLLKDAQ